MASKKPKPQSFGLRSRDGSIPAAPISPAEYADALSRLLVAEVMAERERDFNRAMSEYEWMNATR